MMSVANKPIMLSVILLNVIILRVVAPANYDCKNVYNTEAVCLVICE